MHCEIGHWIYLKSTPEWLSDFLAEHGDADRPLEEWLAELDAQYPDIEITWAGEFEPLRIYRTGTEQIAFKEQQQLVDELSNLVRENPPLRLAALFQLRLQRPIHASVDGEWQFMYPSCGIVENVMVFRIPVKPLENLAPPPRLTIITQKEFTKLTGLDS